MYDNQVKVQLDGPKSSFKKWLTRLKIYKYSLTYMLDLTPIGVICETNFYVGYYNLATSMKYCPRNSFLFSAHDYLPSPHPVQPTIQYDPKLALIPSIVTRPKVKTNEPKSFHQKWLAKVEDLLSIPTDKLDLTPIDIGYVTKLLHKGSYYKTPTLGKCFTHL